MRNNNLLKTNLLVSIILIIGFTVTAVFSYRANFQASLSSIEQVSELTAEGIFYQVSKKFAKPVNTSLAMSHDSLLVDHLLKETAHLEDEGYVETTKKYLETYRDKYGFDSVFLASAATGRYYNFNGIDRVLKEGDPENDWYFALLNGDEEFSLNVDNDQVKGADDEITVFVNAKITSPSGQVMGIVGVGIRVKDLREMLMQYEKKYNVSAALLSGDGLIAVSEAFTGYEKKDWFEVNGREQIREKILGWKASGESLELWEPSGGEGSEKSYLVTRYIPELSWHLIVEQNTGLLVSQMKTRLMQTAVVLLGVLLTVLVIITCVIRNFNLQITTLMEERRQAFQRATEQLYDNIYELNITKNCTVGQRTREYFESLGAKGIPYDEGLRAIAEKQIKEEYREGYINTFLPENVLREYEAGNSHLQYDFMMTQNGTDYFWMRIDAYIFYSTEDECVHMFTYRKNIDKEKRQEKKAVTDGMTGFLNRRATEQAVDYRLSEQRDGIYAFFIFDIDNFKQANDRFGHAFGDYCIRSFTSLIRQNTDKTAILGRLGGDEFAALTAVSDEGEAGEKAAALSQVLKTVCIDGENRWEMSASIGIALYPASGQDFTSLYQKADQALYEVKKRGKNGFQIYSG